MKTPKYKSIKELAAAYKSGAIPKTCKLTLDNDNASVHVKGVSVYHSDEPPGAQILEECLILLGIPFEDC